MDPIVLLIVLLFLLWAVGFGTAYTMGGLLHVLLVIVVILIVVRILRGRPL